MLLSIREIETAGDWQDMRIAMGELLGLDRPVSDQVLARARADERFAAYLLRSRGHVRLLAMLMNASATTAYPVPENAPRQHGTSSLIKKVGAATWRWAASGFKRTKPERLRARLATCRACAHLQKAPAALIYKVALIATSDPRICAYCGCVASRKAAMSTENCPMEDRANPGHSLWGDPLP